MERNFDLVLVTIRGKAMKEDNPDEPEPILGADRPDLTLRAVSVSALLTTQNGVDGKEKFKRWELAKKLQDTPDPDLNAKELAKIRELVGKFYNSNVVGQAWSVFDQMNEEIAKPSPKKTKK